VQGQLLEAERQVQAVKTDFQAISSKQEQHYQEQSLRLQARIAKLKQQVSSNQESVVLFERRLKANLTLEKQGLVSSISADEAREALAQAQRQLNANQQALDQTQQELASLEGRRQDELWQRKQVLSGAQTKRDALAFMVGQTMVCAHEDGLVEAILVRPGETVQSGQALGKVIPQDGPLQVVSFLAEKDRAFVKPGDEVHLELEQLPYGEFGTLRAKVIRISDDLASPAEIREALGDDQKLEAPTYRVELEITDTRAAQAAGIKLRTGMQASVRYTLRRERLAALVISPLRRWFR
jgi:HlyD family secretion protein